MVIGQLALRCSKFLVVRLQTVKELIAVALAIIFLLIFFKEESWTRE